MVETGWVAVGAVAVGEAPVEPDPSGNESVRVTADRDACTAATAAVLGRALPATC
jgi:hypothetical protein